MFLKVTKGSKMVSSYLMILFLGEQILFTIQQVLWLI